MVNYRPKVLKGISVNAWNVLTRMQRRKKGQILYITGRKDPFTTSAKLLNIMHESHGFNAGH